MDGTFVDVNAGGTLLLVSDGAGTRGFAVHSTAYERRQTLLGDAVDDPIGGACAVTIAVGARPLLANRSVIIGLVVTTAVFQRHAYTAGFVKNLALRTNAIFETWLGTLWLGVVTSSWTSSSAPRESHASWTCLGAAIGSPPRNDHTGCGVVIIGVGQN
jgi:hypothetical protein